MTDLLQSFRREMQQLVGPRATVLVAVSGGVDSLALLDLTTRVQSGLGLTATVVHLDHGWRSGSSEDAAFVVEEASRRGIRCLVERAAAMRVSEGEGRRVRLDFFARAAEEIGAEIVLTGHTADDQAETVLMHLLRGAGIGGLGGMKSQIELRVDHRKIRIVRPLLGIRRAQLIAYCVDRDLQPLADASNSDRRFLRNRVRADVLPLLDEVAPGATAALARHAEIAIAERDLFQVQLAPAWSTCVSNDQPLTIDRRSFRAQHLALQRGILMAVAEKLVLPDFEMSFERIEAARTALASGRSGAVLEWPGRVRLAIDRHHGAFLLEPFS